MPTYLPTYDKSPPDRQSLPALDTNPYGVTMNPYEFSLLPRPMQIATLRRMTPQQLKAFVTDFKMIVDQSQMQGMGELSSWFSDTWREVVQPILPYVSVALDVIYPGAGTALAVANRAMFPAQGGLPAGQPVAQTQVATPTGTAAGGTNWTPILLGAGALLLLSS